MAATFFVEGLNAELYPDLLREIDGRGHEVAYHAWRHEQWGDLTAVEQAANLDRGIEAFGRIGLRIAGIRPPGGQLGAGGTPVLREAGLRYCSPAGAGAGAADGVALLPFEWSHVDACCVLPALGAAREQIGGSAEPVEPNAFAAWIGEETARLAEEGGFLAIVLHPFMLGWLGKENLGAVLDRPWPVRREAGRSGRGGDADLAEQVLAEPRELRRRDRARHRKLDLVSEPCPRWEMWRRHCCRPRPGGPIPSGLPASRGGWSTRMPRRLAGRAGGRAGGFAGVLADPHGATDRSLPPRRREDLLRKFARLGGAPALDAVKSIVLLASGADAFAAEIAAVGARHEPSRPDSVLDLTPGEEWPAASRCEAIVIGSGAGGAFAARALARAGLATVIVEEGERWGVERIRASHPLDRFAGIYRDGGTTMALGNPPIALPLGRAVGGTTVINSGTCFRPPTAVATRLAPRARARPCRPRAARPTGGRRRSDDRRRSGPDGGTGAQRRTGAGGRRGARTGRARRCAATRRAAVGPASARSAAPTTPRAASISTPCPRHARRGHGSPAACGSREC